MERQANPGESPTNPVISDMSHARPTTRGRVTSEGQRGPVKDPERFRSSLEAAQKAKEDAERRIREASQQLETQPELEQEPMLEEAVSPEPPAIISPQRLQADLSQLVTTGKIVEETVIAGFKFRLHTLTAGENNEAMATASFAGDDMLKFAQLRIAVLARAIDSVNGVPLENLYSGSEKLNRTQKRIEVVGSWQNALAIELFNFYETILQRSNSVFVAATKQDELLKN